MAGSSSSSTTNTPTSTVVTDRRTVADGGAVVLGEYASGNNITTTDHGAIAGAVSIASEAANVARSSVLGSTMVATSAIENSNSVTSHAFDFAQAAGKAALNADAVALTTVKDAYQQSQDTASGNRTLAFVGLTIAAVLGVTLAIKKAG